MEFKIDELNLVFLDFENIIVDIKKGEGEI